MSFNLRQDLGKTDELNTPVLIEALYQPSSNESEKPLSEF